MRLQMSQKQDGQLTTGQNREAMFNTMTWKSTDHDLDFVHDGELTNRDWATLAGGQPEQRESPNKKRGSSRRQCQQEVGVSRPTPPSAADGERRCRRGGCDSEQLDDSTSNVEENVNRCLPERKSSASNTELASAPTRCPDDVDHIPAEVDQRHRLQAVSPAYVSSVTYIARPMSVVSSKIEPNFIRSQCAAVRKLDRLSSSLSVAARSGEDRRSRRHVTASTAAATAASRAAEERTLYEIDGTSSVQCAGARSGSVPKDHRRRGIVAPSPSDSVTSRTSRCEEPRAVQQHHSASQFRLNLSSSSAVIDAASLAAVTSLNASPGDCHSTSSDAARLHAATSPSCFFASFHLGDVKAGNGVPSSHCRTPSAEAARVISEPCDQSSQVMRMNSGLCCESNDRINRDSSSEVRCELADMSITSTVSADRHASTLIIPAERRPSRARMSAEPAPPTDDGRRRRSGHRRVRRQDSLLMSAMMSSLDTISGEWARDSERHNVASNDSTSDVADSNETERRIPVAESVYSMSMPTLTCDNGSGRLG